MTWHIHIMGLVQGVGFRPFVFLTAKKYELGGKVHNSVDGVHIVFNSDADLAMKFRNELSAKAPPMSRITRISLQEEVTEETFEEFRITSSVGESDANMLIAPDFALCETCSLELTEEVDRRSGYPFITCTNCGPRFSIIESLPYDRENTKMDRFEMCPACSSEYVDPTDRRYYSQTNSCPSCGIQLSLLDAKGRQLSNDTDVVLDSVVDYWKQGRIVAIKGIGGYLLTCDASNGNSISELRKRKNRPSKPFAVMYHDLGVLHGFHVTKESLNSLVGPVSPIVILPLIDSDSITEQIAPGLDQVGVMQPYAPLYKMLLQRFNKPIVATSGNVSNSPIIFEDGKAIEELSKIADFFLTNNRDIVVPQDDSVVKYTFWNRQRIVLRRARGLAPTYINQELRLSGDSILAMGSMLKSTFCLLYKQNCYVSQYLGDLEHFDAQRNYEHTVQHFLKLFKATPEVILCDLHMDYASSQYGRELSERYNVPIKPVQHHVAHFAALLGESNLLHADYPILGVIWDGTGLGSDGQIWGGEFFIYENYAFERYRHFDYFGFILGDKMPKEPRISALSSCWGVEGAQEILKEKFSEVEWRIYSKLLDKEHALKTSSVGRLFDAVASLLGVMDVQTYEGEAAMKLEVMASSYFSRQGLVVSDSYEVEWKMHDVISTKSLLTYIVRDVNAGVAPDFIAAKFHLSLVRIIEGVAIDRSVTKLAFSGGVFQNGLLVDLICHHLGGDFDLFFHQQLSPNDENVSFGQQVHYQIEGK